MTHFTDKQWTVKNWQDFIRVFRKEGLLVKPKMRSIKQRADSEVICNILNYITGDYIVDYNAETNDFTISRIMEVKRSFL
jgi:hypothetical protein